jgi:MinD-like ATPase involved in chromosome partitioning or flagellar assembly
MAQKPFSVMYPDTKASQCIKEIAEKVSLRMTKPSAVTTGAELTPAKRGVFKRIFDFFQE